MNKITKAPISIMEDICEFTLDGSEITYSKGADRFYGVVSGKKGCILFTASDFGAENVIDAIHGLLDIVGANRNGRGEDGNDQDRKD